MDVHGLFTNEPDVFGGFTDVSRFVRGEDKNADATVFWRNWEPETVKLAELDGRPYHAMTVVQSRFIGCETFSATKGTAGFGIRSSFSECWRKT